MGNVSAKQQLSCCLLPVPRRRAASAAVTSDPLDEGLGHSFCYVSSKLGDEPGGAAQFRSISGASVSANPSTALSTAASLTDAAPAAAFDSSASFASYPLYPVPLDRAFLSGPIDRASGAGFLSGPLDPRAAGSVFSGPLSSRPVPSADRLRRSLSHGGRLIRNLSKKISRTISVPAQLSIESSSGSSSLEIGAADDSDDSGSGVNDTTLQWAQGKAGEDRMHVVVSEDHGWIFVGIYDGFNGPDATDFLLSNLYSAVQRELRGLLWVDDDQQDSNSNSNNGVVKKRRIRWRSDWDKESEMKWTRSLNSSPAEVLMAMNAALRRTEEEFFDIADKMGEENPELALMGSCALVMVMKGEDVYLMNVGDSRAVLGQSAAEGRGGRLDLERIIEDCSHEPRALAALQLTMDHSTCVQDEVRRIRREHPEDACAVMNDRVKGSLKVTRAFGAGFLKQPKWNDGLLEMFRIDYVGTSPYITCNPFLYHHRIGPKDRFLILSSDGLYQYFTNEEAVAQVELFMAANPEGDPAQHLVEEVIFRAAKKAGLDFHELLEIPQGDRRRYHDDVSVIVISFEGRIWRSCV